MHQKPPRVVESGLLGLMFWTSAVIFPATAINLQQPLSTTQGLVAIRQLLETLIHLMLHYYHDFHMSKITKKLMSRG